MSLDTLHTLLARARAAGAERADAILVSRTSLSVERRLGSTETLERSESQDLGLRVFCGAKSAIVSASNVDPARFAAFAERAVAMARVVPDDPYADLCDEAAAPESGLMLDLVDAAEPGVDLLIARAEAAEAAALAVSGVTNSEGGSAGFGRSDVYLATSAGFAGQYARTGHSISASVLAGSGTSMQRDYDYHSTIHFADLDDPAKIGHSAGERAVSRLNPIRPKTGKMPVVYDPRVSGSLVGHLSGAINGASIARGTSFLKDKMGQKLFASGVFINDDPRRVRGSRSGTFDGEGVPTRARSLIEDGVLTTWILDSRSAKQLGLRTTGHAARAVRHEPLSGGGQRLARRSDGRYRGRPLHHRTHWQRHQQHDRRLQPWCRRLHDPQRCAGRTGRRDHHCRQSDRNVRGHDTRQRPRLPPRHRCAHHARGRDDGRR
jgi:PmbA protein